MEENELLKMEHVDICRDENVVLSDISLTVRRGEFVYLIGKVGSGKSSLLKALYREIPIEKGQVQLLNFDLTRLKKREIPYLRRKLGIVFQDFQLLTDRTVFKNLEFVLRATGWKKRAEIETRADEVLTRVGMPNKGYKMPHELSGGEQQRVAIARALLNTPALILADEPTGNLDSRNGKEVMTLLKELNREGTTIVMVTHSRHDADYADRIIHLFDGQIVSETNQDD